MTVRWSAIDPSGIPLGSSGYETKFRIYGHSYEMPCCWPGPTTYRDVWFQDEYYSDTALVSGDPTNGVFESSLRVLPLWREDVGTFELVIWAKDHSQNQTGSAPVSQQVAIGSVDLRGPSSDVTPPTVSLVSIVPEIVSRGGSAIVRWSASDPSGIENSEIRGWDMSARFYGSLYGYRDIWFQESAYTDTVLVSGDLRNGIFETVVEVSSSKTPGVYELSITATDWRGNKSSAETVYGSITVVE